MIDEATQWEIERLNKILDKYKEQIGRLEAQNKNLMQLIVNNETNKSITFCHKCSEKIIKK